LHGIASANFVRHKFACTDKQVLNAIADHVMPPQHAPKLTMILYLADKLESNKNGNYQNPNNYYLKKAEHNLKGVYQYIRDINAKDKTF
jgi:HD superfamily phosphohydrolase YqeK